jgi:hypothetical protein
MTGVCGPYNLGGSATHAYMVKDGEGYEQTSKGITNALTW